MREHKTTEDKYRYNPAGKKRESSLRAEEDIDRYYELVRLKLAPGKLRRLAGINVLIITGVLAVFFLGSLLLAKPSVSTLEKRDLAKMPAFSLEELFQGTLTRDIETWFADTFPMRDAFVALSAVVDESRGVRIDDVRIIAPSGSGDEAQDMPKANPITASTPQLPAAAAAASRAEKKENTSSASSMEEPVEEPIDEGAVGAISNGTFVYKGMAMSLFGGSRESAAWYADVLNTYQKELPGVQIYDMIIPTAIEFYVPNKYRDLTQSQKDLIQFTYDKLDSGIKTVDAYSKLSAHKDEYLYFRTDHHWTGLGAYYAYTAFCEQAGLTPISLEACETKRLDNFIGTMYGQTQDTTLLQNPDYVDYYIFPQEYTATRFQNGAPYYAIPHTLWGEYAQSPNSYSVFLHGDFPLIKVQTDNHNGRKVMVVKESFGNAFAPFLINHYEEVYIVDQRYFQLPAIDFIKTNGINELIFANNSFAVCTPYHIRSIDGMRHQPAPYGAPAPVQEAVPAMAPVTPPPAVSSSSAPPVKPPVPQVSQEPVKQALPQPEEKEESTESDVSSKVPKKLPAKESQNKKNEESEPPEEMDDKERTALEKKRKAAEARESSTQVEDNEQWEDE